VRVPLAVVDALVASSKGGDDLDVGAALRALATHGDTDLVNIKDGKADCSRLARLKKQRD